jgi:hypothetical protein
LKENNQKKVMKIARLGVGIFFDIFVNNHQDAKKVIYRD